MNSLRIRVVLRQFRVPRDFRRVIRTDNQLTQIYVDFVGQLLCVFDQFLRISVRDATHLFNLVIFVVNKLHVKDLSRNQFGKLVQMTEKTIQTLSQSEILALKRKKKKNNSESSQSRLDKILGAYSRDIDHTAPIDMVDNVPCLSVDEPEDSGISDGAKDHAGDGEGRVKETLAREPAIPKDPLAQTEGFPGFNAMEDVVVPEDIFVERTPAPDPSQPSAALGDALSWVHALVLSVFIAIAFGRWFTSHAHEMFGVDKLQTHHSPDISNVWWKKMCRQLDWVGRAN